MASTNVSPAGAGTGGLTRALCLLVLLLMAAAAAYGAVLALRYYNQIGV